MPAWRSWTPVRSFSGLTLTMVTTGVRSAMYSPTFTGRSETTPADRRAYDGVGQLLGRKIVGGAAVLEQRLLPAHVVHGGLIRRLGHLQARVGRLHLGRREQAALRRASRRVRDWPARLRGSRARSSPRRSDRRAAACRRRHSGSAMPSWARVCRSALSARARASASSFGSSVTSGSPTRTSRPISTATERTTPAASALTLAWSGASSVPARSTWRCTVMRFVPVV